MKNLYVFALVEQAPAPFSAAGHRIEFVEVEGVYAAVERIRRAPAVTEDALRAQHEVVEHIANRVRAILPARFGALVDERELGAVVFQRRTGIREALALVLGRRQMTARLLAVDAAPAVADSVPSRVVSGTEYLEGRRAAASPPLGTALAGLASAVRSYVVAERAEGSRGRVLSTVYHLIDQRDEEAYRAAAAPVQRGTHDSTLTISGPWAPFAFGPDLWA